MWRRACLGDRDAIVAVGYLWAGACIAVLVVMAARISWPVGIGGCLSAALVTQAAYWLRRRRWNRWIRRQGIAGIAAVEVLLRTRGPG